MTTTVFLVVCLAALLHATWNAFVKGGKDKDLAMAGVVIGHVPFALVALCFVELPAIDAWRLILASVVLHTLYQLFLLAAYRIGDLTQVYPLARGSAPLIVAGVSVAFLGVALAPAELLGIGLIAAGIVSLALVRRSDGLRNPRAALLSLGTGLFIAAYSIVDGLGARASGSPVGFYAVAAIGNAVVIAIFFMVRRPGTLRRLAFEGRSRLVFGGGASFAAYALVVWAFAHAPIALVTALRETSILFALLIGVFVLKERLDLAKVFSTMMTICGAVL
ncbi:MAG: DMT family transporter, partial [Pseudomonadota bacterium]